MKKPDTLTVLFGIYLTVLIVFVLSGLRISIAQKQGTVALPKIPTVQKSEPNIALGVNYAYRCDDIIRHPDGRLVCEIDMQAEDDVIGDR